uniref:G-protein coupled receptors family 1 profile domain-containing protein n=1 Tax=Panagrolaimus sp. PS1159 TaxID=55785 RepID=A0AC35GNT9_9BILA
MQVLLTHFQPWYVTFYYDPANYGMLSEDFYKYLTQGQSFFFFTFHLLMMIIPIGFYSFAIALLFKHRNSSAILQQQQKPNSSTSHANVEARLIIPCIFNSVVFIIGQVVITIGTGEGKWATWMVMLLFSCNSAVNPVLLLLFSAIIRNKILHIFGIKPSEMTRYMIVQNGQTSCSPSPPLKGNERFSSSRSIPVLAKVSLISYNKDPYSCAV